MIHLKARNAKVCTTIAEVKDIGFDGLEADEEDVTTHSSAADGPYEEVIMTILRTGSVSFDLNFVPTHPTHDPVTGLLADWKNRTKRNYQLVFPDDDETTWQFAAYVKGFGGELPVVGVAGASVDLRISGAIDFAP